MNLFLGESISIPNLLTLFRIILVPVFIVFIIKDLNLSALIVFIMAGLTDAVDGFLARRLEQKTEIGFYIDPLADKTLLISTYLIFTIKSIIPLWFGLLVIGRDTVVLLGIALLFFSGRNIKIWPSILGKATVAAQVVTVVLLLIYEQRITPLIFMLIGITALFTIASGIDYIVRITKKYNK